MKEIELIEVWHGIKDFENYKVSNLGQIYSIKTGKILKQSIDRKGYAVIHLYRNGFRCHKKVHRLVAEAFIPNPDKLPEVDHIFGDRLDNQSINLRWVSGSANTRNREACRKALSKYNGVYLERKTNKWYSCVFFFGKNKQIGTFLTEIEAAKAFNKFCIAHNLNRELNIIEEV